MKFNPSLSKIIKNIKLFIQFTENNRVNLRIIIIP